MSLVEPTTGNSQRTVESPAAIPCTHCGLPVPKGLLDAASREQFCCGGCKSAFQLIHSSGLDAFYLMAEPDRAGSSLTRRDSNQSQQFSEFDHSSFIDKYGRKLNDEVSEISLLLDGIHCAACIWLIEKLPRIVPGVLEVKLNWARQTVRIRWQTKQAQLSQISSTLYQLGYRPHPVRESENELRRRQENRRHLVRIGIAAAAAGNNMLIAAALYLGMFSHMAFGMTQLLRIASCVIGVAALLGPGRVFLKGAANAIRTRTPHMDLPIALGLTVGSFAGVINTIRGTGEIWFDTLSVLIFLLLVGRWFQFRQQNRAADAVEMLYQLTPKTARKIVDGQSVETFVDLLHKDDLLDVRPGDLFPVDAVIVDGSTEIDESILSGESRLLRKTIGDEVLAGTQNRTSAITVKATATGCETRLNNIVELVEQASLDKPAIVQWANQIGGYFVIAVITLATVTLFSWLWIDASVAVDRTVALLIVACPCALALATPLAIAVALGRAAKRKILIKGGDVLQVLNRPGMIWLDKTGTLTEGRVEVVDWHGDTAWKPAVAALEAKSSHPVAEAIFEFAKHENWLQTSWPSVDEIVEYDGSGISGVVGGDHVLIGNAKLLFSKGVDIDHRWRETADRMLDVNLSPCWVAVNNNVVAVLSLGDLIRADTLAALDQLKAVGWEIGILSGDHQRIVQQVAKRLGIQDDLAVGGLSPEEKVQFVRNSAADNRTVVMVGDGVNDSAALAAASVGIAVHNGAEASLAAAPVYLAEEGLNSILELIRISKSTRTTIRRNFAVSVGYNFFGATFAAIGWINPLVAAILMPISSLTVVAISLTAGKSKR